MCIYELHHDVWSFVDQNLGLLIWSGSEVHGDLNDRMSTFS